MAVIESEAIVLKQFDLGEADKIITFYSKDYGKIRAVAKGVRKSKSKLSGIVLPFSYNYITIYQGRSLDRINQVNNIFSFIKLREDLTKMAYASFMAELIEKVGLENDSNQPLFSLLLASYYKILEKKAGEIKYIELAFKILLMAIIGFKPELNQCLLCDRNLGIDSKNNFNVKYGGLICNNCLKNEYNISEYNIFLSGESIQILNTILKKGLKPMDNIKISRAGYQNLDQAINKFMFYHLDINLKSLDFLNMIKNLGKT